MKSVLILILFSFSLQAQSLKDSWKIATPMFISGIMNGTVEVLRHDYASFQRHFPKANAEWWNPAISWENKWMKNDNGELVRPLKERFVGSSTVFVATTDAYHTLRLIENTSYLVSISIALNSDKKNLKIVLIQMLINAVAYYVGFNLTYEYLRG